MNVVAVRGAIQVKVDRSDAIREATARLLKRLVETNRIRQADVISAFFTATPDLSADFPAHAARTLGWTDVPLLGAVEMGVPGAPPRLVRILLLVRASGAKARRLVPVYMDGAERLRPDLFPVARAKSSRAPRTRVAIVGLGQIGGSIGLALGRAGDYERVGFDRVARVRSAAAKAGAVDRVAPTLEAACRTAKLAIVAVPADVLPQVIDRVAAALPKGAVLMDTGSTRRGVTEALERAAARGLRAVGGHPIAGTEGRGLTAARADLFDGATFALLPVRSRARSIPPPARRLVRALGARPLIVDPATHDRALARTSHLPYLLSIAIAATGHASAARGLAGPGFASMTRLAKSDPRVAEAYCAANRIELSQAWSELQKRTERALRRLRSPKGA